MANIVIEDLERDEELDRGSMIGIRGGHFGSAIEWMMGSQFDQMFRSEAQFTQEWYYRTIRKQLMEDERRRDGRGKHRVPGYRYPWGWSPHLG
jgi:hypothetical protein